MRYKMQPGHVETGLQLYSRLNIRPTLPDLDKTLFPNEIKHGEAVEISGNVSSGKTFLITHLMAKCILPAKSPDQILIGGQNAGVIFINTDHHFRIPTIVKVMKLIIAQAYKSANKNPSEDVVKNMVKSSLDNLTIIDCYERLQFRLTIISLENVLLHNESVALVVIDGLVAFYWEDRDQDKIWHKDSYLKYILQFVQKYTTSLHKVCLIYTISSDFMPADKEYLNWASIESTQRRINLFRTDSNDFSGMIRSKNCEERIFRYEITENGWKWL